MATVVQQSSLVCPNATQPDETSLKLFVNVLFYRSLLFPGSWLLEQAEKLEIDPTDP
jgi:hypothetical protein